MIMLDSNAAIRVMRFHPRFIEKLAVHRSCDVFLSAISYHELRYGALHSANPDRHLKTLEDFVEQITITPFTAISAKYSAQVRENLAAKGAPIGPLDTLIAGHALEHELTLVTGNIREFSRVEGLTTENWS